MSCGSDYSPCRYRVEGVTALMHVQVVTGPDGAVADAEHDTE